MKAVWSLSNSFKQRRMPTLSPLQAQPAGCKQMLASLYTPQAARQGRQLASRAAASASCSTHSNLPCSRSSHAGLLSSLKSSSSLQHCSRMVKCYSTPNPTPPGGPVKQISWLHDVQVWCPDTHADQSSSSISAGSRPDSIGGSSNSTDSSSSSSSSSSGTAIGSSSSTAIGTSNGSSTATAVYSPPHFQQLPAAQLQGSSSTFDAIIVLAGGLTLDGGLPEWVHRRMDVARDLHMMQGRKPAIVCSGGGTPHKPAVLGSNGHVIHESTSGANYLMATGVQAGDIYKEVSSYDTVGNAYYSLCIHVIPAGWRRVAVVTSDFHMARSRALFCDIYRLAGQSLFGDPAWFSLTFLSASDEGVFDDHVYNARLGKEAGSLDHWQRVAVCLSDFPAFREWIHTDHLCYAVPRQHEFGKRTIQDPRLLDSY